MVIDTLAVKNITFAYIWTWKKKHIAKEITIANPLFCYNSPIDSVISMPDIVTVLNKLLL